MTPRFSVVMPVRDVRQFLPDAVASIEAQDRDDVELIAVDDGSTDGSREWLQQCGLDWVTPVLTGNTGGPGRARAMGLERASGEFVLFLDSDDLMMPGLLDAVDDVLSTPPVHSPNQSPDHSPDHSDSPGLVDVVLFDHVRLYPDGSSVPSPGGDVLSGVDGVTTLDRDPELLRVINVVWNKVYRRDWLARAQITFPEGLYEDIPYSVVALTRANSIAVLPRAGVAYRVRPGSTVGSTSADQTQVVEQWGRAWEDAAPAMAPATLAELYGSTVRQLTGLYQAGRVPPSDRDAYVRACSVLLRRVRPNGWSSPGRYWALRESALRRGNRRALDALDAVGSARSQLVDRWAHGGVAGLVNSATGAVRRRYAAGPGYRRALRQPLRNQVLFESWSGKQCSDNPRAIYDELVRSGAPQLPADVQFVWVIADAEVQSPTDAMPGRTRTVVRGTHAYYAAVATSRWVVNNDCDPSWWVKRDGMTWLQTWHGTPLKRIGLTANHLVTKNPHYLDEMVADAAKWDALISANGYSSEVLPPALGYAGPLLETGYPRNDVFFDDQTADARRTHAARTLGIDLRDPRPIILYAPTWRDGQVNAQGQYAQQLGFDLGAFRDSLADQYRLIVRAHHQIRDGLPGPADLDLDGWYVDASAYPEAMDLCLLADVLITDYSSIMFDFACTGRPLVLYCPDLDQQMQFGRGFYVGDDFWADPPGPLCRDETSLIAALSAGPAALATEYLESRTRFAEQFCSWEDGHASQRVIAGFFGPAQP